MKIIRQKWTALCQIDNGSSHLVDYLFFYFEPYDLINNTLRENSLVILSVDAFFHHHIIYFFQHLINKKAVTQLNE